MTAVLALKRSATKVRYCFDADADPGLLPRALQLIAKRGLVPSRFFAEREGDTLQVEIEVEDLDPATADHVGLCLEGLVGVRPGLWR
ncbi:MAG: hypothetical protein FJX02_17260 [Alphaproteobacteria bacterium]|nr:hypothetical protein [Alphaproteobacteria bacterium]